MKGQLGGIQVSGLMEEFWFNQGCLWPKNGCSATIVAPKPVWCVIHRLPSQRAWKIYLTIKKKCARILMQRWGILTLGCGKTEVRKLQIYLLKREDFLIQCCGFERTHSLVPQETSLLCTYTLKWIDLLKHACPQESRAILELRSSFDLKTPSLSRWRWAVLTWKSEM